MEQGRQNRKLVEDTTAGYQNIRDAKERWADENARKKDETIEQTRQLLAQAELHAQAERERRDDVIRQIRALESVPTERFKVMRCNCMHASTPRRAWT